MNPKDEISPEEKLLRLIRHSDKKSSQEKQIINNHAVPTEQNSSKAHRDFVDFKVPALKESKIIFSGIKSLNFVLINRAIFLAVFVSVILFFLDLYINRPKIHKFQPLTSVQKDIPLAEKELKTFSYYQEEISKHNLFKLGQEEYQAVRTAPVGSTFSELIKNFSLLGIVSGKNPKVVIEDKKSNKTYFLYAGDFLGEIKIEEVYPDRVVLEFRGEKISLFL